MENPLQTEVSKLSVLRATEQYCLAQGVDALSLAALARRMDLPVRAVTEFYPDEVSLLDAVLERHQSVYEREWEKKLPTLHTYEEALRLLVETLTHKVRDEDGGAAYIAIAAQMCVSPRFSLTSRSVTSTPTAIALMGKLMPHTQLPFALVPTRFERFATVLFSSIFAWHRQGDARLELEVFTDDLVETLAFLGLRAN